MQLCCADVDEWIEVQLGVEILGKPRNIVLDTSFSFLDGFNAAFARLLWPVVILVIGVM